MRKFINIADIDKKDLRLIIDNAKLRKEKRSGLSKNAIDSDSPLEGKILIMLFEKPSTRNNYRFQKFFQLFKEMGIIRNLGEQADSWTYNKLNEAERIAMHINNKMVY